MSSNINLEEAIEIAMNNYKLKELYKLRIKNKNEEICLASTRQLNLDLPRTIKFFSEYKFSDRKIIFFYNLIYTIIMNCRISFTQGFAEMIFPLLISFFSKEIDESRLTKKEIRSYKVLNPQDSEFLYSYHDKDENNYLEEFKLKYAERLGKIYYASLFCDKWLTTFLKSNNELQKYAKVVFNILEDKDKDFDMFYAKLLPIFITWFGRNIKSIEYLMRIHYELFQGRNDDFKNIFIIYYALIKKFHNHEQNLEIDNESLAERMENFTELFNNSKIQFNQMLIALYGTSDSNYKKKILVFLICSLLLVIYCIYKHIHQFYRTNNSVSTDEQSEYKNTENTNIL